MPYLLRDGTLTPDVRRDRLVEFDSRSRGYGVAEVIPSGVEPKLWPLAQRFRIDQGVEGACVGFGWTNEIMSAPWRGLRKLGVPEQERFAREFYYDAQRADDWEGGSYPGAVPSYEGTSVLAGAKVAVERAWIGEYRWCFSVDDIMRAVSHHGPVVVGTWWKEGMDDDSTGFLEVAGENRGGHCYLIRGIVDLDNGWHFRITNSWGPQWGIHGDAFISVDGFDALLHDEGEACVPMHRSRPQAWQAGDEDDGEVEA